MTIDEQKQYVKEVKKIDGLKFNKVSDFTVLIDLHNDNVEKNVDKIMAREVKAISEYYAPLFLKELRGEVIKERPRI